MRSLALLLAFACATPAWAMSAHDIFMEQVHSFWGANVSEDDLNIVTGEFNSDSDDDYIGWRIVDNSLQVIAVVKSEKHNVQIANVRIPLGDGGVCTDSPKVDLQAWSDSEKTEHGMNNVGPNAIHIHGGACNSIYLFWPDNVTHAAVDLRIPH